MEMNIIGYDAQAHSVGTQAYLLAQRRTLLVDAGVVRPKRQGALERYKYARFELQHERLSKECSARLQALGVECLMDGRDFEAYGIVIDDDVVRELMLRDPEIFSVEDEEPPAGK